MADKKAVTLEQLEIAKNYIDRKDAENIKSAEFVDDTLKFYTSSDKSGDAVAEITLPEETFLDGSKTEFVSDFSWSITEYPKSTDPDLNGKAVLVLAVKSGRTVRYSFISLDSILTRLVGGDTESTSVSVADDIVTLNVKVSEDADNRIIMKDDGLYVGVVDNTPTWSISTNDEVSTMFSTSSYGAGTLGAKKVGDIVKIKENGVDTNYIVVQKGLPSDMYDESCDGVWLLREKMHSKRKWHSISSNYDNDYENSDIKVWLNSEFLNSIDENICAVIKTVKIPFKKGLGNDISKPVQSGADGLNCKIFFLGGYEVGFTKEDDQRIPIDGARLSYFLNGNTDATAKAKRICRANDGEANAWLLRSVYTNTSSAVFWVSYKGNLDGVPSNNGGGVRPAFILPYDVKLNSDNEIVG